MNENLLNNIPPLTDSGVLHRFPELEGKVTIRDSWLAYNFFEPIFFSGSFTDRESLNNFLQSCLMVTCSTLVGIVLGLLWHDFNIGAVGFMLTGAVVVAEVWSERRQGKLRLASDIIGSFEYAVFLSPRLRRDERKRTFCLAYQLSRVLAEVEHFGPYRTACERLGLPLTVKPPPTLALAE